jgi:hypothetical protein
MPSVFPHHSKRWLTGFNDEALAAEAIKEGA